MKKIVLCLLLILLIPYHKPQQNYEIQGYEINTNNSNVKLDKDYVVQQQLQQRLEDTIAQYPKVAFDNIKFSNYENKDKIEITIKQNDPCNPLSDDELDAIITLLEACTGIDEKSIQFDIG